MRTTCFKYMLLSIFLLVAGGVICVTWFGSRQGGTLLEPKAETREHENHAKSNAPKKEQYYCPMHPQYVSDRPGDCPICGMSLVKAKDDEQGPLPSQVSGRSVVTASMERQQLIGVRLGSVERKRMSRTIRAVGRVEFNERKLSTVSLRFGGWIEKLDVNATGDRVQRGTPLLQIYSPDLLEAQQNYLVALQTRQSLGEKPPQEFSSFAEESLKSARDRLLLWDITPEQIMELEKAKKPKTLMTIFSKTEGVVTRRNVTVGSYVPAGTEVFSIADLSEVWVRADVYEYELPDVKVGLEARLSFSSMPGRHLIGRVVYIYPYLNEQTRTAGVRFEVSNKDEILKPGMYSTVSIDVDLGEQLVVDDQAILDSGERQIVFVDQGQGRLGPREVTVGGRSNGLAMILKGLDEGERIVTSGNFLIDAESRLKAALREEHQKGAPGGHQH